MHGNKAYFRIYGEKVRAKSRAPKEICKNTPEWFNYQVDDLLELNPLKKVLNVDGIPLCLKNDKEGFIKNIKKTQPKQIKYLLEDMDEEVRRLKNAVLYVGFCNRQFKTILKNEEKALEERMNNLQKILRNSLAYDGETDLTDSDRKSVSDVHADSHGDTGSRNYKITHQMSGPTKEEEEDTHDEKNFVIDNFSEGGNEAIRDANCEGEGNYLLKQLQRQLLEMNNKLKVLKMEYDGMGDNQNFKELNSLKKKIKEQKNGKKENMLKLHKLNEKFLDKSIKQDKIQKLVKK
jgi:hypothetical protein